MSEFIKVNVISRTGSDVMVAELYPSSGLLKMGDEWSSVSHEKSFDKKIVSIVKTEAAQEESPEVLQIADKKKGFFKK